MIEYIEMCIYMESDYRAYARAWERTKNGYTEASENAVTPRGADAPVAPAAARVQSTRERTRAPRWRAPAREELDGAGDGHRLLRRGRLARREPGRRRARLAAADAAGVAAADAARPKITVAYPRFLQVFNFDLFLSRASRGDGGRARRWLVRA